MTRKTTKMNRLMDHNIGVGSKAVVSGTKSPMFKRGISMKEMPSGRKIAETEAKKYLTKIP